MSDLDLLLIKYRKGTISESEMEQLHRLTRRDEVMESASRCAAAMRRRRQVVLSVSAMALLLGGVGALLFSNHVPSVDNKPIFAVQSDSDSGDTNLVGSEVVNEIPVMESFEQTLSVENVAPSIEVASNTTRSVMSEPVGQVSRESVAVVTSRENTAPQVMCNVGCDADSVINDVWEFLNA